MARIDEYSAAGTFMKAATLLLAGLVFLPGCKNRSQTPATASPSAEALSSDEASRLILPSLPPPRACKVEWEQGALPARNQAAFEQARALRAWITARWLDGKELPLAADKGLFAGWKSSRNLTFRDASGYDVDVGWVDFENFQLTQVEFTACAPESVTILDTTLSDNGKVAEVIYTAQYRYTDVAQRLGEAGLDLSRIGLPPSSQMRVTLRRLDATGWQVERL